MLNFVRYVAAGLRNADGSSWLLALFWLFMLCIFLKSISKEEMEFNPRALMGDDPCATWYADHIDFCR